MASRRQSEQLIAEGLVSVNGEVVTRQGQKVEAGDAVTYRGARLYLQTTRHYIALHKPPGYLCSNSDPEGRPLAIDLLGEHIKERLYNVGRLDYLSSGLLLFTNDGEFARRVTHPSSRIEKEYLVEATQPIPDQVLWDAKKGIAIGRDTYRVRQFQRRSAVKVGLVLDEGKNREIRVIFEQYGIPLRRVHRVRIGGVRLATMRPGEYRRLSPREVRSLLQERKQHDRRS